MIHIMMTKEVSKKGNASNTVENLDNSNLVIDKYEITPPTDFREVPPDFWKRSHTSNITF